MNERPLLDNEHEALVVDIPEEIRVGDIVDPVVGWFRAEVQVLKCQDCGKYEVSWRPLGSRTSEPA